MTTDEAIESALSRLKVVDAATAEKLGRQPRPTTDPETLFKLADIPIRHQRCRSLERGGAWGATFDRVRVKIADGVLIALVGNRGSGKTQMGVELIREALATGLSCRFASATKFFMEIKATYRRDATDTEEKVLRRFTSPRLLVLDEIGRRGETDWENRLLFELLNDRYNDCRSTILISNHDVEGFAASMGPSLVSRINETGGVIDCSWKSFRETV